VLVLGGVVGRVLRPWPLAMQPRRPVLSDAGATVVAGCLLVLGVIWAAPGRVVDADALSRLSMGRWLLERGAFPLRDPWTFCAPEVRFGDPEWLGDLGLYAVFARFHEAGLQAAAIGCACVGYVLALLLGRALGGRPLTLLGLLLSTLPVAAPRISPRNDVHLFWLFPLLGLLCLRAHDSRRAWSGLLVMGMVWASLHSSFVVAWAFLIAALWLSPSKPRFWGYLVVLAYPLLPLLGPGGVSGYVQLFDHLLGAGVYRALLSEWQSPLTSSGWLAILPLYVLSVLGLAALVAQRAQPRLWSWWMFGVGCALAYASRRFLPALAYLIVPAIAGSLHEAARRLGRSSRAVSAVAGLALAAYLVLAARSSSSARERASVFEREPGPQRAIAFLRAHAPVDSHVASAFNDGPWLLWFGQAAFQHCLDPRNNLGAHVLDRYVHAVLADGAAFEREAARLDINLALIPQRDPAMQRVHAYLSGATGWRLTYWDGSYALFARYESKNRRLLEQYGYRTLLPTLDLSYLAAPALQTEALARDLSQLDAQARTYADVIRAYLQLRDAGGAGPRAVAAAKVIAAAWPSLPDTTGLARALSALPQPAQGRTRSQP
jgi:hypothetical protein